MHRNESEYTRFNMWPLEHWSDAMPGVIELRSWDGHQYRPLGKAVRIVKHGDWAEAFLTLNGGAPVFRLQKLPQLHQLHENRGVLPPRFLGFFVGIHIPREGRN